MTYNYLRSEPFTFLKNYPWERMQWRGLTKRRGRMRIRGDPSASVCLRDHRLQDGCAALQRLCIEIDYSSWKRIEKKKHKGQSLKIKDSFSAAYKMIG